MVIQNHLQFIFTTNRLEQLSERFRYHGDGQEGYDDVNEYLISVPHGWGTTPPRPCECGTKNKQYIDIIYHQHGAIDIHIKLLYRCFA